jgi:hypothetical protein
MLFPWQDGLRKILEQFKGVTFPARDLWYGRILGATGVDEEAAWEWVAAHEQLARKPLVLRDGPWEWGGRYFGDATGLAHFRSLADAAFRCLESAGLHDLTRHAESPCSARSCDPRWLDVLLALGEEGGTPLLLARPRCLLSVGNWVTGEPAPADESLTFAFLEQNVFTSSEMAIERIVVPPQVGEGADEWMPASKAVERAQRAGLPAELSGLIRSPEKHGVKTRPRQLPGNHRLEVEFNSYAGYLARKKAGRADAEKDEDGDPPVRERESIEERKKEAREKKRQDRTPD